MPTKNPDLTAQRLVSAIVASLTGLSKTASAQQIRALVLPTERVQNPDSRPTHILYPYSEDGDRR